MRSENLKKLVGMGLAASIAVTGLVGCTDTSASTDDSKPNNPTEDDKNEDKVDNKVDKDEDNNEDNKEIEKTVQGKMGEYKITYFEKEAKGKVVNVTSWLHVRVEPSLDAEIVDRVFNDNELVVLGKSGDWYVVRMDNKELFVHKNYVEVDGIEYSFDKAFDERLLAQGGSNGYIRPTSRPSKPSVPTNRPSKPSVPSKPSKPSVPSKPSEPSVPSKPVDPIVPPVEKPVEPQLELNAVPVITGKNIQMDKHGVFELSMLGLKATDAEDGDLTSNIVLYSGSVNTNVAGNYDITVKVSDSQGATTFSTFVVTVVDTDIPSEVLNAAPALTLNSEITCKQGEYNENLLNLKAIDAEDGDITESIKLLSGKVNVDEVGDYTLVYSVTDKQGATTKATAIVHVIAKEVNSAPQFKGIRDITLTEGDAFDVYNLGITVVDAEEGPLNFEVKFNNVDPKHYGKYSVILTATDSEGLTTTAEFAVKVNPKMGIINAIPVITVKNETVEITEGEDWNLGLHGVSAYDAEDKDLTSAIKIDGTIDNSAVGTQHVTISVTDKNGAIARKVLTVNVKAAPVVNTAPVITAFDAEMLQGKEFNMSICKVSATDKEDGNLIGRVKTIGSVNTKAPGVYPVKFTVTDDGGLTSSVTVNVTVKAVKPTITVTNPSITLDNGGKYDTSLFGAKAVDANGVDITDKLVFTGNVDTSKAKTYEVTISVKDAYGSTNSVKVSVTVKAPVEKTMSIFSAEFKQIVTKEMYKLVADYRAENGVRAMTVNPKVEECANAKSKHMYDNNYFDHRYDGKYFWDLYPEYSNLDIAGENIVTYVVDISHEYTEAQAKEFALKMFNTWKGSPLHNGTMLSELGYEIGFGFYISPNGVVYGTQHFVFA